MIGSRDESHLSLGHSGVVWIVEARVLPGTGSTVKTMDTSSHWTSEKGVNYAAFLSWQSNN